MKTSNFAFNHSFSFCSFNAADLWLVEGSSTKQSSKVVFTILYCIWWYLYVLDLPPPPSNKRQTEVYGDPLPKMYRGILVATVAGWGLKPMHIFWPQGQVMLTHLGRILPSNVSKIIRHQSPKKSKHISHGSHQTRKRNLMMNAEAMRKTG